MGYVFINSSFLTDAEAQIGVTDIAIRRGFGIFDFFRTVGLKPLFIDEHLKRFYRSAEKIDLEIEFSFDQLKDICLELIDKNRIENGGVRLILTGGYSENGYLPSKPNLIITNEPLKLVNPEFRDNGVKIITHNYQREFPTIKTINYFTGIMMQREANKVGAYDVLYHNDGIVRELTRSNIFIVTKEGSLITPEKDLLYGITRKHVLDLATEVLDVEEREITLEECLNSSEVFTTGTTKRILPIIQIDHNEIGDGKPGKVTKQLYEKFYTLEKRYISS